MEKKMGNLSIDSDNIFPIIKKWLYSDHDIFYRELISNGCDAITKRKKLDLMGEASLPSDYKPVIRVELNPEKKTITITDNGIGMSAEEIDKYINQIAFSGATDFFNSYKDRTNEDQIIGHFGLGFYSVFMVADKVTIESKSYREGEQPVLWSCTGGTEYEMGDSTYSDTGTRITIYVNEDCLEFCNEYRASEVLKKYCSFMPYEIYLSVEGTTATQTIDESDRQPEDVVIEEVEPAKEGDPKRLKIRKRPELLNEIHPLWTKNPSECTKEDYIEFYRKVFRDYKEPLFWIHLNMDYPFNMKGILYFPRVNLEYERIEGTIKLYNNQVFVADNIKEVIPEFLMLLKGVLDCPDLPLNVSRSALQNDGTVTKIQQYITKKVADKLSGMCKTEREDYEKYWNDISPFVKFGCLRDDKFCEKMTDYILFKNLDGKYLALPEALEVNRVDTEEDAGDENTENENKDSAASDSSSEENTDAENAGSSDDSSKEEEKKDKTIYYVTDENQQSQYINMFRKAKMDAFLLTDSIDQPFISQLESKNEGIHFKRIDADIEDALKTKTSEKAAKEYEEQSEMISKVMKKSLKKDNVTMKVEKLKNKKIASMATLSEESRRMQDMMKMYSMGGGMGDAFPREGLTLILNAGHPLVKHVLENPDAEETGIVCQQLYDLAMMQIEPLGPEEMTAFIARSNDILMKFAGESEDK
ncbi:MAG: molecular chaperone HtpG [Lachnospiraceae bacterium]|nr:molecular chaperone HtpG [Lachnospiraceae bacterium]